MNDIFVKGKVIPEYLLQDIIYDLNNITGRKSGVLDDSKESYNESIRSSTSKTIDPETYPDLNNILTKFCSVLDKKYIFTKLILKEMEYLKYGPADHFKKHSDAIYDKNPKEIRRFTTVTLLSKTEDLEGGNLIIFDKYDSKLEANLEVGETVLFYSSTFHKVTPIIKGGREVLVGWIYDL